MTDSVQLFSPYGTIRTWSASGDLIGTNGMQFNQPKTPDIAGTPAFPAGILTDMVTTLATIQAPGAVSNSTVTPGLGSQAFALVAAASLYSGTYQIYDPSNPTTRFMIATLATPVLAALSATFTINIAVGTAGSTWVIAPLSVSQRRNVLAKSADYAIAATDANSIVKFTAGGHTATLPAISSVGVGFSVCLMAGTGTTTIAVTGGDSAPGGLSSLTVGQAIEVEATAAGVWSVTAGYGFTTAITGVGGITATGTQLSLTGFTITSSNQTPAASGISGGTCIFLIAMDTSGGVKTVTLPGTLTAGDWGRIIDAKGTFGVNSCTVVANGNTVNDLAADYAISENSSGEILVVCLDSSHARVVI